MGLEARIWALRQGFWLQGWDLDLEAGIWAERWGRAGTKKEKEEKEEEKEKFLHM